MPDKKKRNYISNCKFFHLLAEVADCTDNPCQNGGTCVLGIVGVSCTCQAGYTGDVCDTGMNLFSAWFNSDSE